MDDFIKMCIALALSCAGGDFASAQEGYIVSGMVEDGSGPVAGAAVVELGTSNGTSTDLDGMFSLRVAGPQAEVEISCIGYASRTFVASQIPKVITLMEDSEFLDEIVVDFPVYAAVCAMQCGTVVIGSILVLRQESNA